jgi:hypothetical protein
MAPSTSSLPTKLFQSTPLLLTTSTLLRILLLLYGLYQDAHSPLKYTDIDYHVFTSAAQYASRGLSPYTRETYRYTPLLSFMLLPTTWSSSPLFFHSGKLFFALCDIVAGWLLIVLLRGQGMSSARAGKYASIWLLNPMVATISTRGSSEGILGVMTAGLMWAVVREKWAVAGWVLGLATHFKIYPVVYGVSVLWWMDGERIGGGKGKEKGGKRGGTQKEKYGDDVWGKLMRFMSWERVVFVTSSLITFCGLNVVMYKMQVYSSHPSPLAQTPSSTSLCINHNPTNNPPATVPRSYNTPTSTTSRESITAITSPPTTSSFISAPPSPQIHLSHSNHWHSFLNFSFPLSPFLSCSLRKISLPLCWRRRLLSLLLIKFVLVRCV